MSAASGDEQPTLEQIAWAQQLTGTYKADSAPGYYTLMDKIFDMARLNEALLAALKELAFQAMTSGGVAGRDIALCAAIDKATALLNHAGSERVIKGE